MLERFRAFWTAVLRPVANLLIRLGVSPDAVTLVGTLGVCAGALVFYPQGKLLTGTLVITAFVFSDLIDGYMARTTGRVSKFGAFWDSTLDRIADGAIFIGLALYFAWDEPSRLYLVLTLVCLLMGAVTSYARSRGETLGFSVKVGIAERADRLVAILVMTGLSAIFDLPVLLYIALWALALASTVTVGQRVWVVRKQALAEAAAGPAA
ncbi:phosphatidylinositol phosphate synthase [Nocardioides pantholopis]|uniref:phosphatidylinositol phosphate synthase n=1 Tax=Nocardioides pantholopis TaxID=2483798 RepID=UPI000F089E0B|nr:CDP-alcohol phosphatidyltransferase family protein [Nocardioides pantholopis]